MSDLFAIGQSGLKAYSSALSTVSQNISNAENPNYVRRSTQLSDVTLTGVTNPLYQRGTEHNGVAVAGIARSADQFLEASVRQSGGAVIRTETATLWLGQIEIDLDNAGENVGKQLNQTFSRGEQLAAAPFDITLRQTFLSDIQQTMEAYKRTSNSLSLTSNLVFQSANQAIATLNVGLKELAHTNVELRKATEGTAAHASLLDQRDTALTVISEQVNVQVDFGTRGIANVSYAGQPIVNVNASATTSVTRQANGSFTFNVDGAAVAAPSDGALAGLSTTAQTIVSRQQALDAQAQKFVTDVNTWQAAGLTDANVAGGPILAIGANAASVAMLTHNPTDLALATRGGAANGNILLLSGLRGTGGSEHAWNTLVGAHANIVAAARGEKAAASAHANNTKKARDDLSRVDLDREAADLIRLQQAYTAAARVIQVARETTQSILSIF